MSCTSCRSYIVNCKLAKFKDFDFEEKKTLKKSEKWIFKKFVIFVVYISFGGKDAFLRYLQMLVSF